MRPLDPESPCPHMEGFLNRYADGSAGWLGRWYARAHSVRCGPCAAFLAALIENRRKLRELRDEALNPSAISRLGMLARQIASDAEAFSQEG